MLGNSRRFITNIMTSEAFWMGLEEAHEELRKKYAVKRAKEFDKQI